MVVYVTHPLENVVFGTHVVYTPSYVYITLGVRIRLLFGICHRILPAALWLKA